MDLVTKELAFSYGSKVALDGVSIEAQDGKIFGLVGPNAAGKTTTLRLLSGISNPHKGTIMYDGHPFGNSSNSIKRRLGIVSQENNMERELTLRKNLWFHGLLYDIPSDRLRRNIDYFLDWLQITRFADLMPLAASGGTQRRFIIARALITEPDFLLMDEPTIELDPLSRRLVHEEIKSLNKEGKTVFITTNYVEEAERLCHNVAIIHNGKIVETGKTSDLIARHTEVVRVTASFTDSAPDFDQLSALGAKTLQYEEGEAIFLLPREETSDFLGRLLSIAGEKLTNLQVRPKTLEELVLEQADKRL